MTDATHAYVGIKPCGCCVTAHVDKPEYAKDIAKSVASWIKDGLRVERMSLEQTRVTVKMCDCPKPAATLPLFGAALNPTGEPSL